MEEIGGPKMQEVSGREEEDEEVEREIGGHGEEVGGEGVNHGDDRGRRGRRGGREDVQVYVHSDFIWTGAFRATIIMCRYDKRKLKCVWVKRPFYLYLLFAEGISRLYDLHLRLSVRIVKP